MNYDFLSSIEFVVIDSAEAFVFQNPEHLEEVLKILNKRPKKLSGLNDINRLKDIYTDDRAGYLPKFFRQNIVVQKFQNQELNFIFDQSFNSNVFGRITSRNFYVNQAEKICQKQNVKITLRRVPFVSSYEHASDARFKFFTKKIWDGLYDNNPGYTVVFVPNYFDFVKLRTFIKGRNAQVVFISEYSDKRQCQRSRQLYESGTKPVLVISERAIVFVKIRLRYARTVVLYGLPESPDTLTACLGNLFDSENWKPILNTKLNAIKLHKELSEDEKLEETR